MKYEIKMRYYIFILLSLLWVVLELILLNCIIGSCFLVVEFIINGLLGFNGFLLNIFFDIFCFLRVILVDVVCVKLGFWIFDGGVCGGCFCVFLLLLVVWCIVCWIWKSGVLLLLLLFFLVVFLDLFGGDFFLLFVFGFLNSFLFFKLCFFLLGFGGFLVFFFVDLYSYNELFEIGVDIE